MEGVAMAHLRESDLSTLAQNHIRPCVATASFICSRPETCGIEIACNKKSFLQHLKRSGHGLSSAESLHLWHCALNCSADFKMSHPLRLAYRQGGTSHGELPPIEGLPVVLAFKCPLCDFLAISVKTIRLHGKEDHNTSISRMTSRSLEPVRCQSLSRKKASKKLFLVSTTEENEDSIVFSERLMHAVATYDPGQVPRSHIRAASDREKSSLVSLAQCQERLDSQGLEMEDAWSLVRFPTTNDDTRILSVANHLSKALEGLFVEARELFTTIDSFRSTLLTIGTSGTLDKKQGFRFLPNDKGGNSTMEKYARTTRVLLLVACRVYLNRDKYARINMSVKQSMAAEQLLCACGPDAEREAVQEKVHRLLCAVLFQESSIGRGSTRLFASAVAACLCVSGDSVDKLFFKQGTQLSPIISAILYAGSCCALLEIRKYSDESIAAQVEKTMERVMGPEAKAGISVFVDLRSICATVRAEEVVENKYRKCPSHKKCGMVRGVELSAVKLGAAVVNMQADLRKTIFEVLLKSKALPDGFRASCDVMVDDVEKATPGYWALADVRNATFVGQCTTWMQMNVVADIAHCDLGAWCQAAKDLVPLLLCTVHLSGGAPSRGTELGSMSLRNTHSKKRGFFFVVDEVMIIPTFHKMRAILRGAMSFISRHLDKETSFLFKAFFLLVHPVIVAHAVMEDELVPVPVGVEGEQLLQKRSLVRDSVCLGTLEAEDVAREIGCVFAKYEIEFTFSLYRHWQRGYSKERGAKSAMSRCYKMGIGEDGFEDDENLDGTFEASILQAGHSMRTARLSYAQTSRLGELSAGATEEKMDLFRQASYEWHQDLGLRKMEEGSAEVCSEQPSVPIGVREVSNSQSGCQTMASANESLSPAVMKSISDSIATLVLQRLGSQSNTPQNVCRRLDFEKEPSESVQYGVSMEPPGTSCGQQHRFEALQALRNVTKNPQAEFRSDEQRKAMEAIAENRSDVAVVLSTGCGKTAVVMGPIAYEQGVTVWVFPLRALRDETKERLEHAGITTYCSEWYADEVHGLGNVLLVAPEEIGLPELSGILNRLSRARNLNRIVIDEAHIPLFSREYRECMVRLQTVGAVGWRGQRVLLTATAPEAMLVRIARICGVERDGLEVIRGDPRRPNLVLNVLGLEDSKMDTLEKGIVIQVRLASARARRAALVENRKEFGAKCLIVCLTIADVHVVAETLKKQKYKHVNVLMYHSKMKTEHRNESQSMWKLAKPDKLTVMVATDGFSTGTDAPDVRSVIIAGGSRSLIELWQACGRGGGGRDGKAAYVTVLFHGGHLTRASAGNVTEPIEGAGNFEEWARNKSRCRRAGIEETMEGLEQYPTCTERGNGTEACDVCRQRAGESRDRALGCSSVTVCGSKRPSETELERAHKKRALGQRESEEQTIRMRKWGKELSKYCAACLFDACTSRDYMFHPKEYAALVRGNVQMCNLASCRLIKLVCVRCLQPEHRVKDCKVLPSVQGTGKTRCRRCFIEGVNGRNIHWPSEFGRALACPFEACTKFVMVCYRNTGTRESLLEIVPIERRQRIRNATEFADWLVNDNVEDHAGIFEAMEWAHKHFKLKYFDI